MTEHLRDHFAQPEKCPYCGCGEIEGDSVDIETTKACQPVRCLGCGRQWQDVYHLSAIVDDQGQEHQRMRSIASTDATASQQRDLRQRDIVPPDRLATCRTTIIGVGAIGRQVSLQMAAIGVPWLQFVDPDTVEPVNLACQGYLEDDLGRPKVEATADLAQQINHQLEVYTSKERFRRSMTIGNIVCCCVDSITTRRHIWDAAKDTAVFFSDGRMSAEVVRVLTVADGSSREHYPTTLFEVDEAFQGACTARSTIFCANIAAGLMIEQFSRWLRRMPIDADLSFNLLASEITLNATMPEHVEA